MFGPIPNRNRGENVTRRDPFAITFTVQGLTVRPGNDIKYLFVELADGMNDLTGFQRDLLYVIAGADKPSGQDIKSEIERYYSSEIDHGRLYPNLDTLVNKGLVEKGELDRRTNYYAITEAGEQAIRERQDWERQYTDS